MVKDDRKIMVGIFHKVHIWLLLKKLEDLELYVGMFWVNVMHEVSVFC